MLAKREKNPADHMAPKRRTPCSYQPFQDLDK